MKIKLIKSIYRTFFLFVYLPIFIIVIIYYYKKKELIEADINRLGVSGIKGVVISLIRNKSYRNLFYHRIGNMGFVLNIFLRKNPTLHIFTNTKIGKGLVIVHGDATFINCISMGENCYVNQCVTIGVVGDKRPVIGNNCRIATGAIVLGDISIGDNTTVAAGCVVVKDVPANCLVVGNPAIIKRKDGINCNIKL